MERETGEILMSRDEEVVRFPASTTKIMTALVALQFCDDLDAVLTVSESAVAFDDEKAERVPFKAGEQITLRTALYGLLVKSGNDAANVIAEYVAGDVPSFVNLMNQTAAAIGCTSTNFVNPHGLHDDLHYTTAHDLARIMDAALDNETLPRHHWDAPPTPCPSDRHEPFSGRSTTPTSDIHILPDDDYYYRYSIGGKTGFTSDGGLLSRRSSRKGRRGDDRRHPLFRPLQPLARYQPPVRIRFLQNINPSPPNRSSTQDPIGRCSFPPSIQTTRAN